VLKRQFVDKDAAVKVTFALPLEATPQAVSVVGDFNGWDPAAHPLRKRTNGTRSVSVTVPAGGQYRFKYLDADGSWFCDDDADALELNEYHATNSVLNV
jgi:1,4-alpha-glucan branching enzyme